MYALGSSFWDARLEVVDGREARLLPELLYFGSWISPNGDQYAERQEKLMAMSVGWARYQEFWHAPVPKQCESCFSCQACRQSSDQ